ncbi:MAG: DUF4476 domain-containing protein [Archangium sp.]
MPRLALLSLLFSLSAFAGRSSRALEDLQDLVEDSDADCARTLSRKLNALADALDDGSSRSVKKAVREVRGYSEEHCPKKLNAKVRRALEKLGESSSKRRDDDDDDDEEDGDRPRKSPARIRRDCGTGPDDPACESSTFDTIAFRGLVQSLQSTQNELTKLDLVRNSVANQRLTAAQLGPVLDAFQNELLRLDAARAAVPTVVDPQHALVHASKWRNSLLAADFTRLLNNR